MPCFDTSLYHRLVYLRTLLFIVFVWCTVPGYGQITNFIQFTLNDGLPSNVVYHILQDNEEYLWFATDGGVSRFDGVTFQNFNKFDGLGDNEIFKCEQDSKGRIWFLSFNGELSYYYNGKFYNSSNDFTLRSYTPSGYINNMFEDSLGSLYFTGESNNLIVLHPDSTMETLSMEQGQIPRLIVENDEQILVYWIGISSKITYYTKEPGPLQGREKAKRDKIEGIPYRNMVGTSGKGGQPFIYKDQELLEVYSDGSQKFIGRFTNSVPGELVVGYNDKSNWYWVGTNYGLFTLMIDDVGVRERVFLEDEVTSGAFEDSEGNLWISTLGAGLFLTVEPDIQSYSFAEGEAVNRIEQDIRDSTQLVWAGTSGYFGYYKGGRYLRYSGHVGNPETHGTDIIQTKGPLGNIFSLENGISFDKVPGRGTIHMPFAAKKVAYDLDLGLYVMMGFHVWNYSADTLLEVYDNYSFRQTDFNGNIPTDLDYARKSNAFFAGTVRNHSLILDGNELLIASDRDMIRVDPHTGISSTYARPIEGRIVHMESVKLSNGDSVLWMLSETEGLVGFTGGDTLYIRPDSSWGAPTMRAMFVENDTCIWIGSKQGLIQVRFLGNSVRDYYQVIQYTTSDGLTHNQINDVVVTRDTVFLADESGITVVPKANLATETKPPPIYLGKVYGSQNQVITISEDSPLPHTQNNLIIRYNGVHFRGGERIHYRYRLQPEDPWLYTTAKEVSFFGLAPGRYTFEVQAQVPNSPWSLESAKLPFTIATPYWLRPWFWSTGVLFIISLIWLAMWIRLRRVKEREELNIRASSAELKALRAQINPHFIFNALSSIQRFVLQNNREEANVYLTKFSRLIRMILNHSDKSEVTLEEEFTAVRYYLDIERMRLSMRFDYEIICENESLLRTITLPPMILHTFVENSIWHGISPSEGKGKICIEVVEVPEHDIIKVQISDDGVGRKASSEGKKAGHKSKGLRLVEEKIEVYNQMNNQFVHYNITDLYDENSNPTGTLVSVIFPFPK